MEDKDDLIDWLNGFLYVTACLPDDWQILTEDKEAGSLIRLIASMYQKYKDDKDVDLNKDDVLWLTKSINHIYNASCQLINGSKAKLYKPVKVICNIKKAQ